MGADLTLARLPLLPNGNAAFGISNTSEYEHTCAAYRRAQPNSAAPHGDPFADIVG